MGEQVGSQDFSPGFLSTLCAYYKPIKINRPALKIRQEAEGRRQKEKTFSLFLVSAAHGVSCKNSFARGGKG
jgi:hypothetical protein